MSGPMVDGFSRMHWMRELSKDQQRFAERSQGTVMVLDAGYWFMAELRTTEPEHVVRESKFVDQWSSGAGWQALGTASAVLMVISGSWPAVTEEGPLAWTPPQKTILLPRWIEPTFNALVDRERRETIRSNSRRDAAVQLPRRVMLGYEAMDNKTRAVFHEVQLTRSEFPSSNELVRTIIAELPQGDGAADHQWYLYTAGVRISDFGPEHPAPRHF